MPPIAAALISSIAPEIIKGIIGLSQRNKANKLSASATRPTAVIQPETKQSLDITKNLATARQMPGQQQAMNRIDTGLADVVRQGSKYGTPNAAALNKNYNDATIQLADGSAGFRERYLNELRGELKSVSELKDRQWDMNQMQPYLDKMQAANQLLNAGNLNAVNALSSMGDKVTAAIPYLGNTDGSTEFIRVKDEQGNTYTIPKNLIQSLGENPKE